METIHNLIGVLTSQRDLYKKLYDLLLEEKKYIIDWDIDRMMDIPKMKDTFFYKEKMLEEARKKVEQKLAKELGKPNVTLNDIMVIIEDRRLKDELTQLKNEITELLENISIENKRIKILYNTNLKLINDFFNKLGVGEHKVDYTKNHGSGIAYKTAINRSL